MPGGVTHAGSGRAEPALAGGGRLAVGGGRRWRTAGGGRRWRKADGERRGHGGARWASVGWPVRWEPGGRVDRPDRSLWGVADGARGACAVVRGEGRRRGARAWRCVWDAGGRVPEGGGAIRRVGARDPGDGLPCFSPVTFFVRAAACPGRPRTAGPTSPGDRPGAGAPIPPPEDGSAEADARHGCARWVTTFPPSSIRTRRRSPAGLQGRVTACRGEWPRSAMTGCARVDRGPASP